MRFRRFAIVDDHLIEGTFGQRIGRIQSEGGRVEAVKGFEPNAFRSGYGLNFMREPHQHRAMALDGEYIRDTLVGQGGGEQHSAVDELAPQVAPYVSSTDSCLIELSEQAK